MSFGFNHGGCCTDERPGQFQMQTLPNTHLRHDNGRDEKMWHNPDTPPFPTHSKWQDNTPGGAFNIHFKRSIQYGAVTTGARQLADLALNGQNPDHSYGVRRIPVNPPKNLAFWEKSLHKDLDGEARSMIIVCCRNVKWYRSCILPFVNNFSLFQGEHVMFWYHYVGNIIPWTMTHLSQLYKGFIH